MGLNSLLYRELGEVSLLKGFGVPFWVDIMQE